jgi:hypothetical protein
MIIFFTLYLETFWDENHLFAYVLVGFTMIWTMTIFFPGKKILNQNLQLNHFVLRGANFIPMYIENDFFIIHGVKRDIITILNA